MASVIIRNLRDATHRALKARAARNARSTEAEIRAILEDTVNPQKAIKVGSALAALGRKHGGLAASERDGSATEPADFS